MFPFPRFTTFIHIQNGKWHFKALSHHRSFFSALIFDGQSRNTATYQSFTHTTMDFGTAPFDIDAHYVGDVRVDFGVDEREDGTDIGGGCGLCVG
jgi:hypothetical protein